VDESIYAKHWDHYVEHDWKQVQARRDDVRWPGDEWGKPEHWERLYQRMFVAHGGLEWRRAVEIGQGSGKFTEKVLRNPGVAVRAYDVSEKFLAVCAERCEAHVRAGRLTLHRLDTSTPSFLLDDLKPWKRTIDALFSIGALVHVDLQYVIAYLIAAAATLKPGGKLILTLGTVGSDAGFQRLLEDIVHSWATQFEPRGSGKYEWVSACLLERLLPRLGFGIDLLTEQHSINVHVVASLVHPELGDELARYLYPGH
jgi:SAM-dependent methyltransferase